MPVYKAVCSITAYSSSNSLCQNQVLQPSIFEYKNRLRAYEAGVQGRMSEGKEEWVGENYEGINFIMCKVNL